MTTGTEQDEEYERKVTAAWEYVEDQGHPYWINDMNGKMQFENPFKSNEQILAELEVEESKGRW